MRTTVSLPEPLLRNAKQLASDQGVTLSVFIEDAVRARVASAGQQEERPFRLLTVRGRLINPDVDLDRTSAMLAEDDIAQFSPKKKK